MASTGSNAYGNHESQYSEEKLFPIGTRKIFLTHNVYKGYPKVHLRFHQNDKITGKLYPTTRGIALNMAEFDELKTAITMMENYLNPRPTNNLYEPELNDFFADDKMVEECLQNIARQAEEYNPQNLKREYDGECIQGGKENFELQDVKKQNMFYGQL